MALEDRFKAARKDAEGRLQAAAGELSGDDRMKAEGEAKQLQARIIDAAGNLKDTLRQATEGEKQGSETEEAERER